MLATPVMINLMEAAALAAVEHLLPAGHQSLGIHLDVRHFAATPVGLRVAAAAAVTAVEGRTITFRVEARDEREVVGEGTQPACRGQRGALRSAGSTQSARIGLIVFAGRDAPYGRQKQQLAQSCRS